MPGEVSFGAYLVSVVLRIGIGTGLAAVAAATGQLTDALGAFAIGVSAPLLVERLARAILSAEEVDARKREDRIESEAERIAETRVPKVEPTVPHGVSPDVADILSARREDLRGQLRTVKQHGEGRAVN